MLHKKTPQQEATVHAFDRMVSAAGWVDKNVLLIASEVNLFLYDLNERTEKHLIDLEKDKPGNRSNDGRSDPWGAFGSAQWEKIARQKLVQFIVTLKANWSK